MVLNETDVLSILRDAFNGRVDVSPRSDGMLQLVAPFFHTDGDMYDMFIDPQERNGMIRITDRGLTLMRLSYGYEINTPNKERIYRQILSEAGAIDDRGEISVSAPPDEVYTSVMRLHSVITRVVQMELYRRNVVRSLFYEELDETIDEKLGQFDIHRAFTPLTDRSEIEIDYLVQPQHAPVRPMFLFGVKDGPKARLVTIAVLESLRAELRFRSVVVHENLEALPSKERRFLTSAVDKQFPDLADFQRNGPAWFDRETA